MKIQFRTHHLNKLYPLRISRGTSTGSDNLYVGLTMDGITGWGEMSPGISEKASTPQIGEDALKEFWQPAYGQLSIHEVWDKARRADVPSCALAALDIALWDWFGKKCNQPLYRIFGLSKKMAATSVTIGINPPDVVKERVPEILERTQSKFLKIKLGSPEGTEADQAMFEAIKEVVGSRKDLALRVDANGGWSPDEAIAMMKWLADRGVEYVEQPLKEGEEKHLPRLFENRPLPIYVDESCRFSENIPNWVDSVDGVNLKLMKCGGLTEALRIVATARAHKVKVMIGCMSESTLSISAGASIGALFDAIDLDSQLNITNDPCSGATLTDGVVLPNDLPGHGAVFIDQEEEN
ncbi:MAG: dipeptide epimerase [Verrucomicrobia bacterium]|nr:dipeptide epimerase [Verrucomicrobiota bacterium]